jgi:hypothetical protein
VDADCHWVAEGWYRYLVDFVGLYLADFAQAGPRVTSQREAEQGDKCLLVEAVVVEGSWAEAAADETPTGIAARVALVVVHLRFLLDDDCLHRSGGWELRARRLRGSLCRTHRAGRHCQSCPSHARHY